MEDQAASSIKALVIAGRHQPRESYCHRLPWLDTGCCFEPALLLPRGPASRHLFAVSAMSTAHETCRKDMKNNLFRLFLMRKIKLANQEGSNRPVGREGFTEAQNAF